MFTITEAREMPSVRMLFLEYAASLDFGLEFQGFGEEVAELPGSYSPPAGAILLAQQNEALAGCVALRPLEEGIAEMKRLYVRPAFRGQGLGRALTEAILEKASAVGYQKIRLDTVPSMSAAIQMYRSLGFRPIPPYCENPVPGASYLERIL